MSAPQPSPRVWVLPTRNTIGLAAVLLAIWYAGASQTNGAAYLLGFMLASVAAISIVHTWANLRGVTISADPIAPVFAGDQLIVPLVATSDRHRAHFAIAVRARGAKAESARFGEIGATGAQRARLAVPAGRRGSFADLQLRAASIFPLGFFTARRAIVLRQPHYVYPKPEGTRPLPRTLAPTPNPRDGQRVEGDDYGGVRTWQTGESQRHIDWKAAARGQPLLIKQWTGEADEILHLDWQALAPLDDEARLSQLARWVVLAERGGASYGLRLPGNVLAPARGQGHYHACLRALAVFESAEETPPR
jgi:uncharacterized protein (DUF58 family)